MTTDQIHAAAVQAGIPVEACDHVVSLVQTHFGTSTPKPADLQAFITALPVWTKIGMTQEAFYDMPATWRMAQGWAHQPPPVSRRPDSRILTAEELKTIEGLAFHEHHERARALQQTPLPQQP